MVFSMRIRRWAVLALCCWSAQAVHAQGLPQIKLEGVTSVDRAAAGSKFEAAVVMDIPAPFHVNAHKPSEDYLRPTTLTLQPARGLTFGPVVYPAPESTTFPFSQHPLQRMNPLAALGLLFVFGLALNATPCVWPIIPITLSYFGGQAGGKRRQTFTLALFYVLGMAVMYSSLGVVAAVTGRSFGFAFQNPWVIGAICLFFVAMALSMFGLFELRPPAFIANKAQARRGPIGAMSMGLIVGVVSAPCTGPVVTALILLIAAVASHQNTGQAAVYGFTRFFT